MRKLARRPNVQKQFNPTKSTTSGSGGTPDATQQSCTVSVLDFATSPPPRPPEPNNRSSGGPAAELDTGHAAAERYRMPELFVDRIINRARKAPRRSRPVTESTNYVRGNGIFVYFKRMHPRFPFLDRAAFESAAANQEKPNSAPKSKSWTCLYHTVLALGCQYDGGGSFQPTEGESWKLFSIALANFTDLMVLPDTVTAFQAVTAMFLYSLGVAGIALEHILMSEAIRRAQNLADAKFIGLAADAYNRTFWVLYSLEKITTFHHGRPSGIVDCDIACPIPHTPDSFFSGDFDWFLCFITHARLLSRAYTSLFAVGVSHYPGDYYLDTIEQLTVELEDWRSSLPDNGFRPGGQTKAHSIVDDQERTLALATHFLYYSFLLTMTRMALRHLPSSEAPPDCARRESAMKTVEHSARPLLELVPLIDLAPYTPIWMMASIPIIAFFVLFDLIIHNPQQQQTAANLALLDVMSAHCNRMDVLSNGALPGDFIGEFAHIARSFVIEVNRRSPTGNTPQAPSNTLQASSFCPQWSLPNVDNYGFTPLQVQPGFSDMSPIPASHPAESMDADEMTMAASHPAGTDVMNLFGVWIPELEPMFYQGVLGQYDGGLTGAQQGLGPTPSLSYEYDNNS
ncbi:fungal specific transcription factor domain containing protein [Colletotrichum tabaci]|uniref:Fungal specific transcription factor domain containing protein n=1 Tax=Colletotrichum tabaci TaxID=1209068 RepID=A0AAV9TM56_9PEZI